MDGKSGNPADGGRRGRPAGQPGRNRNAQRKNNPCKETASTRNLPADGREAALRVLKDCRRNGAWADAALRALLDRSRLSPADAALCSRLVYGVLQNRLLLDFYLDHFCTQRLDHLQHPLPDILRLGAYQILFLDRVPDRAAVGEAVELAKKSGQGKAGGLVNAVLRNLSRSKENLSALPDGVSGLSIRSSHPLWLVERLVELLGAAEAEAFLAADNTLAPLTVQVNPLRTAPAELVSDLAAAGIAARPHPWVPGCLELDGAGDLTALEAFRAGEFFVQDPAARLVTLAAGVRPGQRILDVCAAPGGKSFSAALALLSGGSRSVDGNSGADAEPYPKGRDMEPSEPPCRLNPGENRVLSCDLHANKLRRIREGAARLGLAEAIETVQADGRERRSNWEGQFDTVLADVPCSGLGVIRKKPDIRYKDPSEFAKLPDLQGEILANAAAYVKYGGILVYSTCTILPEENQGVTDAFLSKHPEFMRKPFSLPDGFPGDRETDGSLTLWPHRHGTDGFYLCVMTRQG
ncbi:MAG: 16S rRNA (cytosine(967)-C(5))-methyltransferase RsmB [Oscillibacter sp.]|nr:16S rRNA (cytosine(967)-C(5))-methyltransferase RsmB [Oscillibacter sp.]